MFFCQKGGKDEIEDDDEGDDESRNAVAESILRDFNYKLRCMMMERNRKLTATWAHAYHTSKEKVHIAVSSSWPSETGYPTVRPDLAGHLNPGTSVTMGYPILM